jgi:hypothetical protein
VRSRVKPQLSVIMIVRDEERTLARCIRSLHGVWDELCIVDTGSRDGTLALAERLGARTQQFAGCNDAGGRIVDFALARNVALDMARGDWVLWIDADEVVERGGAARIRRHSAARDYCGVHVTMRWQSTRWRSPRLFRRRPRHRFIGQVHEMVQLHGEVVSDAGIVVANRPDKRGKEESAERNIRILSAILERQPDDRRTLFYLGNALRSQRRLDEAIARYARYLELGGGILCERHAAAQSLAVCQLLQGRWPEAIGAGLQALRIDPRYAESHCLLGDAHLATGDLALAQQWYKSALSCGAPPPDAWLFVDEEAYSRYPRKRMRLCAQLARERRPGPTRPARRSRSSP